MIFPDDALMMPLVGEFLDSSFIFFKNERFVISHSERRADISRGWKWNHLNLAIRESCVFFHNVS